MIEGGSKVGDAPPQGTSLPPRPTVGQDGLQKGDRSISTSTSSRFMLEAHLRVWELLGFSDSMLS